MSCHVACIHNQQADVLDATNRCDPILHQYHTKTLDGFAYHIFMSKRIAQQGLCSTLVFWQNTHGFSLILIYIKVKIFSFSFQVSPFEKNINY